MTPRTMTRKTVPVSSSKATPNGLVASTSEILMVENSPVNISTTLVPIDQVDFDPTNPRIRYARQLAPDTPIADLLLATPSAKALRRDIELSGGLREYPYLQETPNGRYIAREGNTRRAVLGQLASEQPAEPKWQTMPARILPTSVTPRQLAILMGDWHVGQKAPWGAHEKAGHIADMAFKHAMSPDDIAISLRTTKRFVERTLSAYAYMQNVFLKVENGAFSASGEGKWSFFDELFRNQELIELLGNDPTFGPAFAHWVGIGTIPTAADVRKLPIILSTPAARDLLYRGASWEHVLKALEAARPESEPLFAAAKDLDLTLRGNVTMAEILRVRHDPAARAIVESLAVSLHNVLAISDATADPPMELTKAS